METEQSGEFVDIPDAPQQDTVIEKEVVSKMESLSVAETPAITNGDGQQVNGHSGVENGVDTEPEKMEEDPKVEEESVPKDEPEVKPEVVPEVAPASSPSDDKVAENEGKEEGGNQPEQDDKPVEKPLEKPLEAPVNESVPEPAVAQEPAEMPPPNIEEKAVENVEASKQSDEAKPEKKEEDKMADEALAAGDNKVEEEPTEAAKEKPDATEPEVTASAAGDEAKSEVKEQEEDPTPAPGSLAFAILEQDQTKDSLKTTRTLIVLRGLPGSGKSFLASAITEVYKDHSAVLSADDHSVKPESPDGYKAFDDAIAAKCGSSESPVLVVVDDTNHTQDRLAHLGGIAKEHQLVAVFLEPRTEWSGDVERLSKKTKKGLEKTKLEAMKMHYDEVSIPLYYGWFLFYTEQARMREMSVSFLKMLMTLESFKQHQSDFHEKEGEDLDLEQHFKPKGVLHCTTKFTNYGKADGAKEYAEKKVVQDSYGSVSDLSLTALFITPLTAGARVSLSDDQLQLWPEDAEKEAESWIAGASTTPLGSRAHVTLGCAEGVQAVQTGYDLLQFVILMEDHQEERIVEETDMGTLTYFGLGRWYLALKEPISALACFSSSYKPKSTEGPTKKEKKKPKCTIL